MHKGIWAVRGDRPWMGLALALAAVGLVAMCTACTELTSEPPPSTVAVAQPASTSILPVAAAAGVITTSSAAVTTSPPATTTSPAAVTTSPATTTATGSAGTVVSLATITGVSIVTTSSTSPPSLQLWATGISLQPADGYMSAVIRDFDAVFSTPPTASDRAAIDSDIKLTFAYDPTVAEVPAGTLSPLKTRVYQILMLMQMLEFSEALPWTDMTLWDWFCSSVDEIKFEQGDFNPGFANGIIHVPIGPGAILLLTDKFIDPQLQAGLMDILVLFVHEARHAQKDHTEANGTKDKTIAELGSWGVAYHMYFYLADKANFFLDAQGRQLLYSRAEDTKQTRFTQEP
jgi:hypothetical protein